MPSELSAWTVELPDAQWPQLSMDYGFATDSLLSRQPLTGGDPRGFRRERRSRRKSSRRLDALQSSPLVAVTSEQRQPTRTSVDRMRELAQTPLGKLRAERRAANTNKLAVSWDSTATMQPTPQQSDLVMQGTPWQGDKNGWQRQAVPFARGIEAPRPSTAPPSALQRHREQSAVAVGDIEPYLPVHGSSSSNTTVCTGVSARRSRLSYNSHGRLGADAATGRMNWGRLMRGWNSMCSLGTVAPLVGLVPPPRTVPLVLAGRCAAQSRSDVGTGRAFALSAACV